MKKIHRPGDKLWQITLTWLVVTVSYSALVCLTTYALIDSVWSWVSVLWIAGFVGGGIILARFLCCALTRERTIRVKLIVAACLGALGSGVPLVIWLWDVPPWGTGTLMPLGVAVVSGAGLVMAVVWTDRHAWSKAGARGGRTIWQRILWGAFDGTLASCCALAAMTYYDDFFLIFAVPLILCALIMSVADVLRRRDEWRFNEQQTAGADPMTCQSWRERIEPALCWLLFSAAIYGLLLATPEIITRLGKNVFHYRRFHRYVSGVLFYIDREQWAVTFLTGSGVLLVFTFLRLFGQPLRRRIGLFAVVAASVATTIIGAKIGYKLTDPYLPFYWEPSFFLSPGNTMLTASVFSSVVVTLVVIGRKWRAPGSFKRVLSRSSLAAGICGVIFVLAALAEVGGRLPQHHRSVGTVWWLFVSFGSACGFLTFAILMMNRIFSRIAQSARPRDDLGAPLQHMGEGLNNEN